MLDLSKHKFDFMRGPPMQVEREKTVYTVEDDGTGTKRLKQSTKKVTETVFDVHFPLGYSVRLSERELKRARLDRAPRIIDIETGDVVSGASELLAQLTDYETPKRPGKGATE